MAKVETLATRRRAATAGGDGRAGGKRRRCPICAAPAVEGYRPFCSRRCADIDLGRWLKGGYRVPTEERVNTDDDGSGREE